MRKTLYLGIMALLAVSCGGSSAVDERVAESDNETATAPVVETETADASGQASEADEPATLDDYLGRAASVVRSSGGQGRGGGAGGDSDERLEEQRLVQQEIQICMRSQGFEYVPEEVGDGLRFFLAAGQTTLSPADYAATEGFGISTRFDAILEGDIDLTESTSPNDEHVATLSEGEADAWQLALRGAPPVRNDAGELIDPETGERIQGRQAAGGCTGDAQVAVRGDFSALADLADEFAELEERIAADPRVAEINRAWVDCMNGNGFDYQDEAEARQAINTQLRPLLRSFFQGANQQGSDQQNGDQQDGAQAGQPGLRRNPLQAIAGLQLSDEQDAELEALQDLERAIAVASVECQGDTQTEVDDITLRYETEFVAANRAALEAFAN